MEAIQAPTWFEISSQGWKRMNAGRPLGQLVREAVSNVFDAEGVTECKVTVEPGKIQVIDDVCSGIKDKSLITTVFMTDKEESATKRGRKGRGLKELLGAGTTARVETVGHTIIFNSDGTRTEYATGVDKGTKIVVENPEWGDNEVAECVGYLKKLMPPEGICFTVNGIRYSGTGVVKTIKDCVLDTHVVIDGVQKTMKRQTSILVRRLRTEEKEGMLYEMGVPVVNIGTPWHLDVQQRVPMNDNRDVVSQFYKQTIWAEVMDAMVDDCSKKDMAEEWAQQGVYYAQKQTKLKYVKKLMGDGNLAIKSDDKRANDKAKQDGFELIEIGTLPWAARSVIEDLVPDAVKVAKEADESAPIQDRPELREQYPTMVKLYEFLAKEITGYAYRISFFTRERKFTGTFNTADHSATEIRFNTLETEFDFNTPVSPLLLGSLVHEMAHHWTGEHNEAFQQAQDKCAGMLAYILWSKRAEIDALLGGTKEAAKAAPGKLIPVQCKWPDCKEIRMVHPGDVHQVNYCKPHQKEHTKEKAKLRRREARNTNDDSNQDIERLPYQY